MYMHSLKTKTRLLPNSLPVARGAQVKSVLIYLARMPGRKFPQITRNDYVMHSTVKLCSNE